MPAPRLDARSPPSLAFSRHVAVAAAGPAAGMLASATIAPPMEAYSLLHTVFLSPCAFNDPVILGSHERLIRDSERSTLTRLPNIRIRMQQRNIRGVDAR